MNVLQRLYRPLIILLALLMLWQIVVWATGVAKFILPSPIQVASALINDWQTLWFHTKVTLVEIALGLFFGVSVGMGLALLIQSWRPLHRWLLPVLLISQAIPVFALAPLLVLWLDYGMSSKIVMTAIVIFFPVTATCYDGLRHANPHWLNLAQTMNASRWQTLLRIRLPAALPALASGLRMAVVIAPIGAIVGEWVGSSAGLGYLMMHTGARMRTDILFAAIFVLAVQTVSFYYLTDWGLKKLMTWHHEHH